MHFKELLCWGKRRIEALTIHKKTLPKQTKTNKLSPLQVKKEGRKGSRYERGRGGVLGLAQKVSS